ncbi:hypothetical protein [Aminobacter sp. Piv2-1]|uniref:hypothetical protein n=1 Tax=Aminobacter sp. Piv2-1 TaxID=3031122 RepID=UPI00309C389F
MTRAELLARLQELQQMPKFQNRDICTISAVLSKEALTRHVEVCETAAGALSRTDGR